MSAASSTVAIGQEAPDFHAPAPLHGIVTLSQYRGARHVALVFFRTYAAGNRLKLGPVRLSQALCPTCQLMIADLTRHYDAVQALSAEIVAVSTVNPEELRHVLALGEPRFPLCADSDAAISRRYGVYDDLWRHPKPAAFLVDRCGIVRYRHVAEHQTDLPRAAELISYLGSL